MKSIILIAILGVASAASPRQPNRNMGGEDTTVNQYPFIANIHYMHFDQMWMSYSAGVLLTTWTVLSNADYYYFDSAVGRWRVRLGTSYAYSGGSEHAVSRIIIHEGFSEETLENDLAILVLATPAVLSDTVARARIAGNGFNLPAGTVVTTLGWGRFPADDGSSVQLQRLDIPIVSQELCIERYDYLRSQPGYSFIPPITDALFCAGFLNQDGIGTCSGDYGSPLVFNEDIIYGVVSWWGNGCGSSEYPSVNTLVPYYVNWIVANGSV